MPENQEENTLSKGEQTRAALVEAAYTLFVEKGYHATSMRQIAKRANLALGGIYNHFASKEEIFATVLETYHPYRRILPLFENAQGETIEEFVHDAARQIQVAVAGVVEKMLPLMFVELVEFQGRHMAQLIERFLPNTLVFVQRFSQRKGKLRGVPAPVMLRVLVSMFIGYLLTGFVFRHVTAFKSVDIDGFDDLIDIYLHGILDPEG